MYIIFDTETTGLPRDWNAPITDTTNWPRVIQLAWQLHDEFGRIIEHKDFLIKPDGFNIPFDAEQIHGISTELADKYGEELTVVLDSFNEALKKSKFIVGQNLKFDINVLGCELVRTGIESPMGAMPVLDTCTEVTANLCQIPGGRGGRFKLPTLSELHKHLFGVPFQEAHNATADVEATARCFFELIRTGNFTLDELQQPETYLEEYKTNNPSEIQPIGLNHINFKTESAKLKPQEGTTISTGNLDDARKRLENVHFAHLHNHTQFTILQSISTYSDLVAKAAEYKMPAVALTDNGNMMGAFVFEKEVSSYNKKVKALQEEAKEKGEEFEANFIKPIIGCEFNVCKDLTNKSSQDNGYQVVFLAKNKKGYNNLIKLASIAYTEGFYYVPRIDKSVIEKYKNDIIVLTGNLYGEVPNLILNVGEKQAEEALLWWKEQFGEDLYIEVMRHGQSDENSVNETLIKLSKEHGIKLVATNNTFYPSRQDAIAHDVLLCIKDSALVSTPKGRGRGYRFGLDNEEYYFKSQEEMKELFLDLPEAIESVEEIIDKCEPYGLARDVLLPAFDIPTEFQDSQDLEDHGKRGENNYLRHLTFEGAKKRYGEISDDIKERLEFELSTIEKTGYPGYFLIVQDFCQAARDMGVSVGPGRGSAAGSAVAYCIGITNVDPIKYDLLFERFLNPERVSLPDIDIDFDDEGRGDVIDWVIKKYGSNQVAQIITYGTMAAKSSIRDTARVLDLPLNEADRIAKLIPDTSLSNIFKLNEDKLAEKLKNNSESIAKARELKEIAKQTNLQGNVVKQAAMLEGSLRNTGIHACGVIITPEDITNYVPVALAKDSTMWCTQFDNKVVESAGLLKMDFLGLKTLTLIKDALRNIKIRHGLELDPDAFPVDDVTTYEMFQRGETVGIFQYESPGMQKYLKELKPSVFADLIAMNALYRPGPMDYIPSFIKRKHGEEPIVYDLDDCEEYLKETYGITVYQEQVMLLSQKLADFTKGEADTLRKAMGKKQKEVLDKMKPLFIQNGAKKGHNETTLEKIWKDWEAFASYAFNKSHSTCYAWIAYQTAYLKANYPAEYMASVLSNNMNDIKQVTFFMEECRRMGINVLSPDINESHMKFTVNKNGDIRFGLGAIKGLGNGPVSAIISEREENGPFKSIFDFAKRVSSRECNKKAYEGLIFGGGFDSFKNIHRAQFFQEDANKRTFLESLLKYGSSYKDSEDSAQSSLFGEDSAVEMPEPIIPNAPEWSNWQKLSKEKEVIGIYISGHPLDDYKLELKTFCNGNVEMINDPLTYLNKTIVVGGYISDAEHRFTVKGMPFGIITLEDYTHSARIALFGDNYLRNKPYITPNIFVAVHGKFIINYRKEPTFEITNIEFLQNLSEKSAKSLVLNISARLLDQKLIADLNNLFLSNEGPSTITFNIYDPVDEVNVNMSAKNIKIKVTSELLKSLENMNLNYKLN
ncbi:MAG: DNA polymerase III subunit alpha [Crocinitomicaceae bacterium]|nr:DNA polymerase III subunit alpha [Crocinitomicaceae bacterium]